jgi:dTDP-4-dehydrorhamnose reductase
VKPPAIVIFGAGGMLGQALTAAARDGRYEKVAALTRKDADLTDSRAVSNALSRHESRVAVNCVAVSDVDGCERDPMLAKAVNAEAAGNLAEACQSHNCFMVQVSTDYVFDGYSRNPYRETDTTNPLSVYGGTKLEGERLVARAAPKHLIVRTSVLFGAGRENFVSRVVGKARRGEPLEVVDDQAGSPTWAPDLAVAILDLVAAGARGLFHVVNSGSCSRFELATAALEICGIRNATAKAIKTPPPPQGVARRPAFSGLDTDKFEQKAQRAMRAWQEALRDYLVGMGEAGE